MRPAFNGAAQLGGCDPGIPRAAPHILKTGFERGTGQRRVEFIEKQEVGDPRRCVQLPSCPLQCLGCGPDDRIGFAPLG